MRQISIPAAATAIAEIAITPPNRLLVEVLVGAPVAGGATFEAASLGAALTTGVSTPSGLTCVEEGSEADDPLAATTVVVWLTAPVVVARVGVVVLAVVAGAVVAGA